MSLLSLLKKELHWSKRNVLALIFLLVIIPVFFAGTSIVFQDILPRDIPVAVVPEDENVSDTEVNLVTNSTKVWTDPSQPDTRSKAERMLERESVYAIVVVPPDYLEPGSNATFTLIIDGRITPFQSPSQLIQDLLEFEIQDAATISEDVTVEREIVGEDIGFEEYLYPTFLMALIMFFAFTYVPYSLRREAKVLDRLRVEASLESLVASKLLYLTSLMVVPMAVFHFTSNYYDYGVNTASPWAIGTLLLTFLFLATVATTIMVLTRFGGVGQFANLVVLLALITLSGLVFPMGFFSSIRTTIAKLLPTHYAMITVRSLMLKGSEPGLFFDWMAMLGLVFLVSVLALEGAIVYYRRSS